MLLLASVPRDRQQRKPEVTIPFSSNDEVIREIDEAIQRRRGSIQPCEVQVPLDNDWLMVVTLCEQDGSPVVERIEVRHDRWRGAYEDPENPRSVVFPPLPNGGLPLRLLRSITFGDALAAARKSLAGVSDDALALHGFSRATLDEPRRPGRRGHPDLYYAEMAAAYVRSVERGSLRPVEDVAKAWGGGYSATYIRSALHIARQRDLLTKVRRGVAGGALTAKATAILGRNTPE
jgi:hypothetical protein